MYKLLNIFKLKNKFFSSKIKINNNLIKNFKFNLKNKYKLNIYIKKGGCNGFKYNFIKTLFLKKFDIILKKNIIIKIDTISKIYFTNSILSYKILNNKSKFIIKNKNIKTKCNCGISFKIK
ncbi:Iron-sulfur cluster insertion protein ErpA [Candidatus Nasuia deltocephalinicola]|nr:Iron-sulfur cluster insertion protein ErpA [Candidatus Nasuia deltocephalinicola]